MASVARAQPANSDMMSPLSYPSALPRTSASTSNRRHRPRRDPPVTGADSRGAQAFSGRHGVSTGGRDAAGSDDGVLDRPAGKLGAPAQAGLLTDSRQVVLNRARRDVQLPADLVIGESVGDEAQGLEFAHREQRTHRRALAARVAAELAQQVAGERGGDDRAAAVGGDDGLAQLLAGGAL